MWQLYIRGWYCRAIMLDQRSTAIKDSKPTPHRRHLSHVMQKGLCHTQSRHGLHQPSVTKHCKVNLMVLSICFSFIRGKGWGDIFQSAVHLFHHTEIFYDLQQYEFIFSNMAMSVFNSLTWLCKLRRWKKKYLGTCWPVPVQAFWVPREPYSHSRFQVTYQTCYTFQKCIFLVKAQFLPGI